MSHKLLLFLLPLIAACEGFNKDDFLQKYCQTDASCKAASNVVGSEECLICRDVFLSASDAEAFKNAEFELTNAVHVTFVGGNVGIANSDFFKQFPHSKEILFRKVTMDLKSSENLKINSKIEVIGIIESTVSGNQRTNAFHSLPELREFGIVASHLEHTTVDRELLRMNKNLRDIFFLDRQPGEKKENLISNLRHIDDDAFDGLDKLEKLAVNVEAIPKAPAKWFNNKPLRIIEFLGSLESLTDIPTTVEMLSFSLAETNITKDTFKSFKNLKRLRIAGEVKTIDEDAFDYLDKLKILELSQNIIDKLSKHHLEKLFVNKISVYEQ